MRSVFYTLALLVAIPFVTTGAEIPRLDDYKAKVNAAIAGSCGAIATHYPNRPFGLNLTINGGPVYYDGAKVTRELSNLYQSTIIGTFDISACMSQAAEIAAERYLDVTSLYGFTRFPHGLFYDYVATGDAESLNGITTLFVKWPLHQVYGPNEQTGYSRDLAYQLHVNNIAHMMRLDYAEKDVLAPHFLEMAISHMEQWVSGDFFPPIEDNDFRQSYMMGLTMNALIEYYEYVERDPRIPPLIKSGIDDLWEQAWWPDCRAPEPSTIGDNYDYSGYTPGYGGFWYWMDWNESTQTYDKSVDQMPSSAEVGGDLSMITGAAFMWYFQYSGDTTYRDKGLDAWESMIELADLGADGRHHWEATRSVDDVIRWYRMGTGSTCNSEMLNICFTDEDCTAAGGNWNGVTCQYLPVVAPIVGYTRPGSAPQPDGYGFANRAISFGGGVPMRFVDQ